MLQFASGQEQSQQEQARVHKQLKRRAVATEREELTKKANISVARVGEKAKEAQRGADEARNELCRAMKPHKDV